MSQSLTLVTPKEADIPDGLHWDDNHMIVEAYGNWFSFCRKGEALMIHFASRNPRMARKALNEVIYWLFDNFKWCRMLIATIKKRSVIKLANRCGFKEFASGPEWVAMMRLR